MVSELAAVILSGGTARRLGGLDKSSLEYAGTRLLDRALAAVAGAEPVVVVGPAVPTDRPVVFTVEDPPLGGPVAGLLAGAAAVRRAVPGGCPPWTALLAVDMPHVTPATLARLRAAIAPDSPGGPDGLDGRDSPDGIDGAVLIGSEGRRHLAAVLRSAALVGQPASHGRSMRDFLATLRLTEVPATGREGQDVDRPEDLDPGHGSVPSWDT